MLRPRKAEPRPRVWAVGDVHGCADELARLLDALDPQPMDQFVFLGDYIDRGPASRRVVERLLRLRREIPGCTFLRGNHEDMFLGFLGRAGHYGDVFRSNGGEATLCSYGLDGLSDGAVAARMPPEHLEFFDQLVSQHRAAGFLCAHAGVDPRRPFERQLDDDLMWIREDFLTYRAALECTVVHGHTPTKEVVVDLPFRIGLDTGVVYGNRLSCLDLVSGDLVQIRRSTRAVERRRLDLHAAHASPR